MLMVDHEDGDKSMLMFLKNFYCWVMNFKRMLSFVREFLVLDMDFKQTIEIDEEDIRAC